VRYALYICLLLYFPLLFTSGAVFAGDFRPEALGSPLFRALFLLWVADGFAGMILSVVILRRLALGIIEPKASWPLGFLSLAALVMGILPAYILVELAVKLIHYLGA